MMPQNLVLIVSNVSKKSMNLSQTRPDPVTGVRRGLPQGMRLIKNESGQFGYTGPNGGGFLPAATVGNGNTSPVTFFDPNAPQQAPQVQTMSSKSNGPVNFLPQPLGANQKSFGPFLPGVQNQPTVKYAKF